MKIDHLGIAVQSIEASLKFYEEALGLTCSAREVVENQGVRVAMMALGESRLELLEPTSTDTPVGRFLATRGEGLHHICIEVDHILEKLQAMKRMGCRLIDEVPRMGAENRTIAFVHPSASHGVLIELVERKD
ncbi:MAG: methylmalonyl-CoA epimerase [Acidobacteria bacterium]|nr:methylmalonyl-CoA epimerase [Acidobacteriota bacterium]